MITPLFKPQTEWLPPTKFPDLRDHKEISIDLETKDPQLKTCLLYTSPSPRD